MRLTDKLKQARAAAMDKMQALERGGRARRPRLHRGRSAGVGQLESRGGDAGRPARQRNGARGAASWRTWRRVVPVPGTGPRLIDDQGNVIRALTKADRADRHVAAPRGPARRGAAVDGARLTRRDPGRLVEGDAHRARHGRGRARPAAARGAQRIVGNVARQRARGQRLHGGGKRHHSNVDGDHAHRARRRRPDGVWRQRTSADPRERPDLQRGRPQGAHGGHSVPHQRRVARRQPDSKSADRVVDVGRDGHCIRLGNVVGHRQHHRPNDIPSGLLHAPTSTKLPPSVRWATTTISSTPTSWS